MRAMHAFGYLLGVLALAALVLALFEPGMLVAAAVLLLGAGLCLRLYRPPENYVGAVYLLDRLWRILGPEEWMFLLPLVHTLGPQISLRLRRGEVDVREVLTADRFPVDLVLLVYYQLDLRQADIGFCRQVLDLPAEAWGSIIETVLREATTEAVGGMLLEHLLTPTGRGELKRTLSVLLAQRVHDLGLLVNAERGVTVVTLRPAAPLWEAMVDRLAAGPSGQAAHIRLQPLMEELGQRGAGAGWEMLLLEWAAALNTGGDAPQVLIAPHGEQARATQPPADTAAPASLPGPAGRAAGHSAERPVDPSRVIVTGARR